MVSLSIISTLCLGREDLLSMASVWLQTGEGLPDDLDGDQIVNLEDLAILGQKWSGY